MKDIQPADTAYNSLGGVSQKHGVSRSTAQVLDWWFEISSALVGIAAIVGLVIALAVRGDKPLPDWPFSITLNALLALLSTIAVATIMLAVVEAISQLKWDWFSQGEQRLSDFETFDRASRGSWGGLQLLVALQLRRWACVGAIVWMLGLIADPFTQQTILYYQKLVPLQEGTASSPVTYGFNAVVNAAMADPNNPGSFFLTPYGLPSAMKAAIYNALYSTPNEPIPELDVACSSGNCTWTPYSTLGICAYSANVTSHLTANSSCYPGGPNTCRPTLPGGHFISNSEVKHEQYRLNATAVYVTGETLVNNTGSLAFADYIYPLADIFVIYETKLDSIDFNDQIVRDFSALEGILVWCNRTYTSNVTRGVSRSSFDGSQMHFSYDQIDPDLDPLESQILLRSDTSVDLSEGKLYAVREYAHYGITQALFTLFQGDSFVAISPSGDAPVSDVADAVYQALYKGAQDSSQGYQALLENFATSMTSYLRQHPVTTVNTSYLDTSGATNPGPSIIGDLPSPYVADYNATVAGTSLVSQTYVAIRWRWLTPLFAFAILGCLFLLGTILKSSRASLPVWKSSSLATLYGLDAVGNGMSKPYGLARESDLMRYAKSTSARLEGNDDGSWRLVEGSSSAVQAI